MENFPGCDVLVMTAAVGDFAPEKVQKEKIKKNGDASLILKLSPTPDILQEVSKIKSHQLLVGFAAESENVLESARDKLKRKNLDMIVANDISAPGIGFQSNSNQVSFLDRQGNEESLSRMSKKAIANILLDRIRKQMG
jgi:phosphopantothenoylcysteine decarboxylase/phosphopantothenate--cysteine ligase